MTKDHELELMHGKQTGERQHMNYHDYRELCRSASMALGLPDPENLATQGCLDIEGVRIALFFDEEILTDRLFCYVDLGPVPTEARERILERLLMLNLLSGTKTSGVYSVDPASGNAIFCVHLMNPERLSGDDLAGLLRSYADRATNLQRTVMRDIADLPFLDAVRQVFDLDEFSSLSELA